MPTELQDPIDVRRRIERLLERVRRRDAYGTLIFRGHVIVETTSLDEPPGKWRAAIRRRARADKIKVRTGENEKDGFVWAVLAAGGTLARAAEAERGQRLLFEALVPRAAARRHEPILALRDGEETLLICERCHAPGYAQTSERALIGGALFEEDCPYEEPPKTTVLTRMAGWR